MSTTIRLAGRVAALAYGVLCYLIFLGTFLYAIGFVGNLWPALGLHGRFFRGMDYGGPSATVGQAILIDALLLGLFAVQHSGMARAGFKRWWTRLVPSAVERSTYVLMASLCLILLFSQWRPLGTQVVWDLHQGPWAPLLIGLSLAGWLTVLVATFMLNHFELFGLHQVWYAFRGKAHPPLAFATPGLYRAVRHPIYLGFIVAFWSTPTMTVGHLLFAAATTGYILVAIQLEERDLIRSYGDDYRRYRQEVRMLAPWPRRHSTPSTSTPSPHRG